MTETVHAGFIPLIDAAPLIAAHRCGFAAAEGVALDLQRETSWAALRDRFAVGLLDVAHMLAPMPLASNLGLTPLPVQTLVPIALGTGGNTITVARGLWAALQDRGATADFDALRAGRALAEVVAARRAAGQPALTIAVVHPHSVHRYQLAYWLAACDIAPSRDIDVVVLPPPLMPTALQAGQIDAFSAGEPWGSIAQAEGAGHILTTSTRIWSDSPEKVLGVRARWSDARPQTVAGLTRAVRKAALWCDARYCQHIARRHRAQSRPAPGGGRRHAVGPARIPRLCNDSEQQAVAKPGGISVRADGALAGCGNERGRPRCGARDLSARPVRCGAGHRRRDAGQPHRAGAFL
jgi:two-component system, oxyanion-binding sensor